MEYFNEKLRQSIKIMGRNGFKNPGTINDDDIKLLTENIKSMDKRIVEEIYWTIGQIGIHKPDKVEHLIVNAFEDRGIFSEVRILWRKYLVRGQVA